MKAKYRYHRDEANRPLVTECMVLDEDDNEVGWGMSICSPNDNPCKVIGRGLAYQRALWAFRGSFDDLPISRLEPYAVLRQLTTIPKSTNFKSA